MVNKIKAILIFEMLGRPAEHVKSALGQFIDKISEEKGVEIIDKKINEPKRVEQAKQELFTTFSEIEFEFQDLPTFLKIIFLYMPSHVEVTEPSKMELENYDFNSLMNEIIRRLHQYDEIAKKMVIERNILQKQLQQQGVRPAVPPLLQPPEQQTKEQAEDKEIPEEKTKEAEEGEKAKEKTDKKKAEKKTRKKRKSKKKE